MHLCATANNLVGLWRKDIKYIFKEHFTVTIETTFIKICKLCMSSLYLKQFAQTLQLQLTPKSQTLSHKLKYYIYNSSYYLSSLNCCINTYTSLSSLTGLLDEMMHLLSSPLNCLINRHLKDLFTVIMD